MFFAPSGLIRAQAPAGKGEQLLQQRCLGCHQENLISQQRLSVPGWTREVEKMIRWGAAVDDAEKADLVAYLTVRFGVRPAAPSSPGQNGGTVYSARCRSCHEPDLVAQQRLSRAGWVREVEKMIRWGAAVEEAEKEPLLDFLSIFRP